MLRLRFPGHVPANLALEPAGAAAGATCRFELACMNESGATQSLAQPLLINAKILSADGSMMLNDSNLLCKPVGKNAIVDGVSELAFAFAVKGAIPIGGHRIRLELSSVDGKAVLIPYSVQNKDKAAGKWVPTNDISVASVITPVIVLDNRPVGAGCGPTAASNSTSAVGDGRDAYSLGYEDASMQVLPFAGQSVRVFERHNAVSPGFGSIVWDCAYVLARVLEQQAATTLLGSSAGSPGRGRSSSKSASAVGASLRGVRAVDLGSGTGFVGICAALLGAHVLLTDVEPMLPIALHNARANVAGIGAAGGSLACAPLLWGEPLSSPRNILRVESSSAPHKAKAAASAAVQPLCGDDGSLCPPYDLILASEVAYRSELFGPLVQTMLDLVGGSPSAVILLGARRRACCDLDDFLQMLREHFEVLQLFPTAAENGEGGAAGPASLAPVKTAKKGPATSKSGAASTSAANQDIDRLISDAALMSKTSWAPMVFKLVLKQKR